MRWTLLLERTSENSLNRDIARKHLKQIAASAERRFVAIDSSHEPTRVKMWEGMCSACGASGAMPA